MLEPKNPSHVSIVLPAKNEAASTRMLVKSIRKSHPDAAVIVVDDGSDDATGV